MSVTLQPVSSLRVYEETARNEHHCMIISQGKDRRSGRNEEN